MVAVEEIRNRLLRQIRDTKNEELLVALDGVLSVAVKNEIINLDSYKKKMVQLAQEDLKHGRVISEEDLKKQDAQWSV